MNAFRKFEESKIGQAILWVVWVVSLPIQLVLFLGVGLYCAITGKDIV